MQNQHDRRAKKITSLIATILKREKMCCKRRYDIVCSHNAGYQPRALGQQDGNLLCIFENLHTGQEIFQHTKSKDQNKLKKISHLTTLYFSIVQELIALLCFCTFQGAKTPVSSCIGLFALAEVGVYIFKRFCEMDSLNKQSNLTWPNSNNPCIHAI